MNTAANEYNYRFKLTDYALFDRNRARQVGIYGRVSTEHEAQLSALENQLQWYTDVDGGKQVIEVMAEAIQSQPDDAVRQAWGIVPSTLANQSGN